MLFSSHDPDHRSHAIRILRDVVEVVAIVAAGFWAFYVFIYENRIKPSFTDPQPVLTATLQKTSERAGAVGLLMTTEVRNAGAVPIYASGYAFTVLGARMTLSTHRLPPVRSDLAESTSTYFRLSNFTPVYGFGFITSLGNPSSGTGLPVQPGAIVDQQHTFFIPAGRFDLLKVYVDACVGKDPDRPIPSRLLFHRDGVAVIKCKGGWHIAYDVGSLDLRK